MSQYTLESTVVLKNIGPTILFCDIAHHTPICGGCKALSTYTWELTVDHTLYNWEFMYPSKVNHASSLKKKLSNLPILLLPLNSSSSHWQNATRFGQSAGSNSCTTLTLYGFNFNIRVAWWTDIRLTPIWENTFRTEVWPFASNLLLISLSFSGVKMFFERLGTHSVFKNSITKIFYHSHYRRLLWRWNFWKLGFERTDHPFIRVWAKIFL